jgi:hypothetical protein
MTKKRWVLWGIGSVISGIIVQVVLGNFGLAETNILIFIAAIIIILGFTILSL